MKSYLDNNSTTPLLKSVKDKMIQSMDMFADPSRLYTLSRQANGVMEDIRIDFSSVMDKTTDEFIFTSSATESNVTVLKGVFMNNLLNGKTTHIITTNTEHLSIIRTCENLAKMGLEVTYLPVDEFGFVDPDDVKRSIKQNTALISIEYANRETGTIQPIRDIGSVAKEFDIPFHSDASLAFMKTHINMDRDGIDFLTVSSHHIGGPKGIGAMFYNPNKIHHIEPLLCGERQENNLRASTESIYNIIGFVEAVKTINGYKEEYLARMKHLTNKLKAFVESNISDIKSNTPAEDNKRLINTLNYSFLNVEGQALMLTLDMYGVSVFTGASCNQANDEPSRVLLSMGCSDNEALSSIRFSTGFQTTEDEINYAIKILPKVIKDLRS